MLNYQLEIVGEEFVSSIGHSDEFYVNLLFDRSIYRPMCKHMGYKLHREEKARRNRDLKLRFYRYNLSYSPTEPK